MAASHPHLFGSQVSWSHAFGGVPIYVNAADAVGAAAGPGDPDLVGTASVLDGVTLVQAGGHFKSSAVAQLDR